MGKMAVLQILSLRRREILHAISTLKFFFVYNNMLFSPITLFKTIYFSIF